MIIKKEDVEKLSVDLYDFFRNVDEMAKNNEDKVIVELAKHQLNYSDSQYLKWLENFSKRDKSYILWEEFCKKWPFDFDISVKSFKGKAMSDICSGSKIFKNSREYTEAIHNILKFQFLALYKKTMLFDLPKEEYLPMLLMVAINLIYRKCYINKLLYVNGVHHDYRFYFFKSKEIKELVLTIIDEILSGNENVYDRKGNLLFGKKYVETLGIPSTRKHNNITKEWLIKMIGDEKSYSQAIKNIMEQSGYTRDQIRYAIKREGLEDTLDKRAYDKTKKYYRNLQKTYKIKPSNITEIEKLWENNKEIPQVGKMQLIMEKYNCSKTTAINYLKKFGLWISRKDNNLNLTDYQKLQVEIIRLKNILKENNIEF